MPPRDAASMKCPNCGAPARSETARCDYCLARLATISCPACYALIFEGSPFCGACGTRRSRLEAGRERHTPCPACRRDMGWVRVGDTDLLECAACAGTWIEAAAFERLCTMRESRAAILHTTGNREASPPASQPVKYRPCPRCGKLMNRVNFARTSGAVVDVCKGHGTFLDRGELHQIVAFIQAGGVDRARAAERERLIEEQRRLRHLQREEARTVSAGRTGRWTDSSLRDLLSAIFERV